ncbi:NAD(P)-binding protein [Streptomyces canus]|uniref:NAD(P)-binding protein n=1 Tax=Streptomyces canus TaxID=58343 RepID=UPI0033A05388
MLRTGQRRNCIHGEVEELRHGALAIAGDPLPSGIREAGYAGGGERSRAQPTLLAGRRFRESWDERLGEVDYLIIGAGATGMAFAAVLVKESTHTMAIVDRNHAPGGHWTMSYPFIRLHGPSSVYGVHSRPMPSDSLGANLASGHEILDYYDRVMRETLLGSGRVTYLPMHNVDDVEPGRQATVRAHSLVNGTSTQIAVRKRVVDASYMNIAVPAMRHLSYAAEDGVPIVPVNQLVNLGGWAKRFTAIGAGKTGLDACLWLLHHGVDPDRITWITPRDAWMINRDQEAPLSRFGELTKLLACNSVDDVISALEQMDLIIRRDPYVRPSAFRCATVSSAELAQLRKIEHVVRLGRVRRIDSAGVRLDEGSVQSPPGTVYIDCSADGLTQKPPKPVFEDSAITLQALCRACSHPVPPSPGSSSASTSTTTPATAWPRRCSIPAPRATCCPSSAHAWSGCTGGPAHPPCSNGCSARAWGRR